MHRRAIHDHLVVNCPSFEGRIYYPYSTKPDTEKPYCVLKYAGSEPDLRASRGYLVNVEVWIYTQTGDFDGLEALLEEVKESLMDVILTTYWGQRFHVKWQRRFMQDFFDSDLDAICTRADFNFART